METKADKIITRFLILGNKCEETDDESIKSSQMSAGCSVASCNETSGVIPRGVS